MDCSSPAFSEVTLALRQWQILPLAYENSFFFFFISYNVLLPFYDSIFFQKL